MACVCCCHWGKLWLLMWWKKFSYWLGLRIEWTSRHLSLKKPIGSFITLVKCFITNWNSYTECVISSNNACKKILTTKAIFNSIFECKCSDGAAEYFTNSFFSTAFFYVAFFLCAALFINAIRCLENRLSLN